jgi:hypothetical protein
MRKDIVSTEGVGDESVAEGKGKVIPVLFF